MAFDVTEALNSRWGDSYALHDRFLNHQLARVLRTLGFDRHYVRGEGCHLYDEAGQRYLDFLSGFGVYALGRGHPAVKAALRQAIDLDLPNLVQLDCPPLAGLLAERLVARSHPGIERAYFCNSGAEAVDSAIKFARCATRRTTILYADHAFHGLSTGALALNGGAEFRAGFGPLLPGCRPVPFGDLSALEYELRTRDVAAFIVEPIQGKGVYCADSEYWPAALGPGDRGAIQDSARWFLDNGYVAASRKALIDWDIARRRLTGRPGGDGWRPGNGWPPAGTAAGGLSW